MGTACSCLYAALCILSAQDLNGLTCFRTFWDPPCADPWGTGGGGGGDQTRPQDRSTPRTAPGTGTVAASSTAVPPRRGAARGPFALGITGAGHQPGGQPRARPHRTREGTPAPARASEGPAGRRPKPLARVLPLRRVHK